MKIVHLCVSCFYIDGYAYQENELVAQNVSDGHDVVVIASTETYGSDKRVIYLNPSEYVGADGAKVIRLPYRKILPAFLMRKLRAHPSLYKLLEKEKPDVIFFHGLCGWELITASRYKVCHPSVKLYVDSHEDFNNSARSFVSKYILHFIYYRSISLLCVNHIDKIFCVSVDTIDFVRDFYGLPQNKIEYFPLGGRILSDNEYYETRRNIREVYGIRSDDIVFIQSGKIDRSKKLIESLHSFSSLTGSHFHFFIVGHLQEDIAVTVKDFVHKDPRICFMGWKTPKELHDLLCAADVYIQPGSQSATMQMSLCCRCVVILADVPSHRPFMNDNGWLVDRDFSLDEAFRLVAECADRLPLMSHNSANVASRLLDYKLLASRLYRK